MSSLWLPSIPEEIYLNDLIKKYNYSDPKFSFNPIIGEFDKPARQLQGLYKISLNSNNTIIFGAPGSGKENLLSTLIYSSCVSHKIDEINFYILDFGSETLEIFNRFPHVGDFIVAEERNKVIAEFEMLEKEIQKRKELFADYQGSYNEYCKNSGKTVPLIVTILNSYEGFMENCIEYDDYLNHLLREGSKYGIVFVITAVASSSIKTSTLDYFNNKLLLQMADPFDYQYILGASSGLVPAKKFGRGICVVDDEACEFQTSYITTKELINDQIKSAAKTLMDFYKTKVKEIRIMPSDITVESMSKYISTINKIPIGYSVDDCELSYYDLTKRKVNFIVGNHVIDESTFMCSIIDTLDLIKNCKVNIFDLLPVISTDGNMSYYNSDFKEPLDELLTYNGETPIVNIIIGIGSVDDMLEEDRIALENVLNNAKNLNNQYFIIFDNYNEISNVEDYEWFNNIVDGNGIWVGNGLDAQTLFNTSNISDYDIDIKVTNKVYWLEEGYDKVIKGIGAFEEE